MVKQEEVKYNTHSIMGFLGIPGLSFSWKRAIGITKVKQKVARKTGIPTTKGGVERKIGRTILKTVLGKKRK